MDVTVQSRGVEHEGRFPTALSDGSPILFEGRDLIVPLIFFVYDYFVKWKDQVLLATL